MLREQLLAAATAEPSRALYVLVDPTLGDTLQNVATHAERAPLPILYRGLSAKHRPYLLRLGHFGRDDAIEQSVSVAAAEAIGISTGTPRARTVCGWLLSGMQGSALASHLASHAVVAGSSGPRLLRFWDPRVMDMLTTLLTPEQRTRLMRQVDRMFWVGRGARLRHLTGNDGRAVQWEVAASHDWLNADQLAVLSDTAIVNCVLDVLRYSTHDVSTIDPCELTRSIQLGSSRWELRSERDRVMYGVYCVIGGYGFDQRPKIAEAMQQATLDGASAMTALEKFDDYDWCDETPRLHPRTPANAI